MLLVPKVKLCFCKTGSQASFYLVMSALLRGKSLQDWFDLG